MPKLRTANEIFNDCSGKGLIQVKELIEIDRIKSMLEFSDALIESAKKITENLKKKDMKWSIAYIMYYDAFHELVDALIAFDRKKIFNHQCLFSYLFIKYPSFDFDWDFLEKIRTQRNGIHYYGSFVNYLDWKSVEVKFKIYISILRKVVKEKIDSFED
ncbi:MAG: hypothetical protein KKA65_02535 [Nanoarchaeota archaeon]|nr:hypothetical protein [Nanoarchaeota archaeon]MBU4352738.1 hypothetical protein [Nanoarchaeota archaeon]MBU4456354.1 hypothetical protein [Nanoarchaeota archaeon]MCG2719279.1 hypothetical protein [Nanoarchaeota archaeon]